MGTQNRQAGRQEPVLEEHLSLDGRRVLRVTGVREILRFDDSLVLQTAEQLLVVHGQNLALRQLAPEEGRVELRGRVAGLRYEADSPKGGLLRRLFG